MHTIWQHCMSDINLLSKSTVIVAGNGFCEDVLIVYGNPIKIEIRHDCDLPESRKIACKENGHYPNFYFGFPEVTIITRLLHYLPYQSFLQDTDIIRLQSWKKWWCNLLQIFPCCTNEMGYGVWIVWWTGLIFFHHIHPHINYQQHKMRPAEVQWLRR